MINLLLYWFKAQASKFMRKELIPLYDAETIKQILSGYWQRYQRLKPEVPGMPTLGGSVMVHLAAMSTAFYQEFTAREQSEETATQLFWHFRLTALPMNGRMFR